MSQWERFTDTFFNRAVIIKYLPDIYHGIWITLELSILIVIFGIYPKPIIETYGVTIADYLQKLN